MVGSAETENEADDGQAVVGDKVLLVTCVVKSQKIESGTRFLLFGRVATVLAKVQDGP